MQGNLKFLHRLGVRGNDEPNEVTRRIRKLEGEMEGHQYQEFMTRDQLRGGGAVSITEVMRLERWFSTEECALLFGGSVPSTHLTSGDSQPPVTPTSGDLMPSMSLAHTLHADANTQLMKRIFKGKETRSPRRDVN